MACWLTWPTTNGTRLFFSCFKVATWALRPGDSGSSTNQTGEFCFCWTACSLSDDFVGMMETEWHTRMVIILCLLWLLWHCFEKFPKKWSLISSSFQGLGSVRRSVASPARLIKNSVRDWNPLAVVQVALPASTWRSCWPLAVVQAALPACLHMTELLAPDSCPGCSACLPPHDGAVGPWQSGPTPRPTAETECP